MALVHNGGVPITVTDTATGKPLATIDAQTATQVRQRILAARRAQPHWEAIGVVERGRLLRKLRDAIGDEADTLATLLVQETGKTLTEAHAMEILPLLEACDLWSKRAARLLEEAPISSRVGPHKATVFRREARGVVGLICPWNFPLAIGGTELVMALMAGNAVVLKPSEHAPLSLQRLVALAHDVGVPKDVLSCTNGGPEVGAALMTPKEGTVPGIVCDDVVDYVAFTGSTAVGRQVAKACGEQLIPSRVELGGKATAVVLADADLQRAAAAIAWGALCHSGQVCAGVQRVFVDERAAPEFERLLLEEVRKRKALDAQDPSNEVGFLRLDGTRTGLDALVADAKENGARVLMSDDIDNDDRRGHATVVTGAGPAARIWREECFGPLLALTAASGEDGLVALANASPFGLMGAVFSEDESAAKRVASRLKIATIMLNDVVWAYGMSEIPWSGRKTSGHGFSHGDLGFFELCNAQVVVGERARVLTREPFWYPYSPSRLRALRLGTAALYGAAKVRDVAKEKWRGAFAQLGRRRGAFRKGDGE